MNTRFYDIGRHFLRPFYNLFWPSKVTGEENIPDEGGFILCANHVHMRDPLFLAVRLPKRHFTFLAKAELFKNPLLRLVIGEKGLGAIPISRGHSDLGAIREALNQTRRSGRTPTTFIVSHRVTTLADADLILVLENGEIAQQGTHEQLIHQDGLYQRVWRIQAALEEELDQETDVDGGAGSPATATPTVPRQNL